MRARSLADAFMAIYMYKIEPFDVTGRATTITFPNAIVFFDSGYA
jgi:hypothetical protein